MLCHRMLCFLGFVAIAFGFKSDFDSIPSQDPAEESEETGTDTLNQPDEPPFDSEDMYPDDFEDTEDIDDVAKPTNFIDKMSHHRDTITVRNGERFGKWGTAEYCPEGAYAVGYDLKIEPRQGRYDDDTALNAIKLFCEYPGGSGAGEITSTEGRWGVWQGRTKCERKGFLTSFILQVESYQGYYVDDTSANFAKFKCRDLRGYYKEKELALSLGSGYGQWGEFGSWSNSCRKGQAICGIQTKVEASRGVHRDDTALNDVKFFCCK
ncbi:vitelline membrane outer layer protein 1-like [Mercenaria mercenaria]|uniref:vitelline membrane outer layer protein 1-like n=1 Tax=Mercenaria mercenaria TaxID=6596 RepID=UPI00234EC02A|nr:vitelline membrane outer layer protein 1-like [Mercenaria mercenaria]